MNMAQQKNSTRRDVHFPHLLLCSDRVLCLQPPVTGVLYADQLKRVQKVQHSSMCSMVI